MDGSRRPGMGSGPRGLMTIDTMNRFTKCRRGRFHIMKDSEQPEQYEFSPSMTNFGKIVSSFCVVYNLRFAIVQRCQFLKVRRLHVW